MDMNLPVGTHRVELRGAVVQIWQFKELQLIREVDHVWWRVVGGEPGGAGLA